MPNLLVKDIGTGLHFAQETSPEAFANKILEWEKIDGNNIEEAD